MLYDNVTYSKMQTFQHKFLCYSIKTTTNRSLQVIWNFIAYNTNNMYIIIKTEFQKTL